MKVLIDWSTIMYKLWFRMFSANYVAESDLELEEYGRNCALEMLKIQARFKPDDIVFFVDTPPWRTPYLKNWYLDKIDYWKSMEEKDSWAVQVDGLTHTVHKCARTDTWLQRGPLKNDDVTDLQLTRSEKWLACPAGVPPQEMRDKCPGVVPDHIKDHPDYTALQEVCLGYKGKRVNAKWGAETSKDAWKKFSRNLAYHLAGALGGRVIEIPWAEADDSIHVYIKENSAAQCVLITSDKDAYQNKIGSMFLQIWDLYEDQWVESSEEKLKFHLLCKILGGDSSDDIRGVRKASTGKPFPLVEWKQDGIIKSGKGTKTFAEGALEAVGGDYKKLHEMFTAKAGEPAYNKKYAVDVESYLRNCTLIHFHYMPAELREKARDLTHNQPVQLKEYDWDKFMVSPAEIRSAQHEGHRLRESDLQDGVYIDHTISPGMGDRHGYPRKK